MALTEQDVANAYSDTAAKTVSSGPMLIVRLYDRLAHDVELARRYIETDDFENADSCLQHAQKIVIVLRTGLEARRLPRRGRPAPALQHPHRPSRKGEPVQGPDRHRAVPGHHRPVARSLDGSRRDRTRERRGRWSHSRGGLSTWTGWRTTSGRCLDRSSNATPLLVPARQLRQPAGRPPGRARRERGRPALRDRACGRTGEGLDRGGARVR